MNNYISDYNGFNLITLKKHNQYALDGIAKFIRTKKKTRIVYASCQNFESIFNEQWDLFVLLFKNTEEIRNTIKKKFMYLIPLFAVFDDSYLIISKLIGQQIYELSPSCTPYDIMRLYISEMGGILKTSKSQLKISHDYRGIKYPKLQPVSVDSTIYIKPNNHGWLSPNTRFSLRYVLKNLVKNTKNLSVVELGSWLGSSACEILNSTTECSLYCFDHFQNITLTDYKFDKPDLLDKFWMTVPRFETFCKNVSDVISDKQNVFTIKYDVRKSIPILRYNFITPNVVYIDAIKSQEHLFRYLQDLFRYTPKTIVVGDDYVFQSVKNAISKFHKIYPNYIILTTTDCYILVNDSLILELNMKHSDLENSFKSYIDKQIVSDPYVEAFMALLKRKFKKVCELVKKLDINKPLAYFNNNTFYTLVIIEIYSKKEKDAEQVMNYILETIDSKPKKIENSLFLTWQDYKDNYINF